MREEYKKDKYNFLPRESNQGGAGVREKKRDLGE